MKLISSINFNGNCREAFEFYAKLLKGEITAMMTYGEAPDSGPVAPEVKDRIMHAALEADGQTLMGGDAHPQYCPFEAIRGAQVVIDVTEVKEAERLFAALSENGQVQMPLQETFWARRFGMTVDRFGVPWLVNCIKTEAAAAAKPKRKVS